MTRAVLDANVLVSGILSPKGAPAKVLTAWQAEQFHLVLSEAVLDEINRVLHYPRIATRHRWSEERLQGFIEDLAHLAMMTPGATQLAVIAEDPPDDRYLECAIEGEADYIVSGDQHLLELGKYQGIRILTPRAFLDVLGRQPRP
jgi:putative PIN family toxin of toxin-antitoxin system